MSSPAFLSRFLTIVIAWSAGLLLAANAADPKDAERNRPPVIPAWAFGHWVWEDTAHTRDTVEYVVSGYRTYGIPVDAVLFDSPWSQAYNDFTWDTQRYPRAQEMIDELHARGIKVLVFYTGAINRESNDSPVQKCPSYGFVLSHGFAINGGRESKWWKGPCIHVDFTQPAAVSWWQSQVAALHTMGIDGAKIDSPYALFGPTIDTSIGKLANREFGYHYLKQAFDFHTAKNPDFVAMTYAWSGMGLIGWPATSHVNWVGDFRGDWKGMQDQLAKLYQSAKDGFSGLACEIGGYWKVPSTSEQFIRYTQLSCFMPIMINGGELGALKHHLPWRHDEETLARYREFVVLHRDLAPYLFSTGVEAHLEKNTILRRCDIDKGTHELGPWLFVRTITSEEKTVRVVVPKDSDWFDLRTGERHTGGAIVERAYTLDEYPVFVKAGAIIPVAGKSRLFGGPSKSDATTLVLFPGAPSEYIFHQPTGSGTAYRDVRVTTDLAVGSIRVHAEKPDLFRFLIRNAAKPTEVTGADFWAYDEAARLLRIEKRGDHFELGIK